MKHETEKWAVECYPDGYDVIVEGKPITIVLGSLSKPTAQYIVKLHNEQLTESQKQRAIKSLELMVKDWGWRNEPTGLAQPDSDKLKEAKELLAELKQ